MRTKSDFETLVDEWYESWRAVRDAQREFNALSAETPRAEFIEKLDRVVQLAAIEQAKFLKAKATQEGAGAAW